MSLHNNLTISIQGDDSWETTGLIRRLQNDDNILLSVNLPSNRVDGDHIIEAAYRLRREMQFDDDNDKRSSSIKTVKTSTTKSKSNRTNSHASFQSLNNSSNALQTLSPVISDDNDDNVDDEVEQAPEKTRIILQKVHMFNLNLTTQGMVGLHQFLEQVISSCDTQLSSIILQNVSCTNSNNNNDDEEDEDDDVSRTSNSSSNHNNNNDNNNNNTESSHNSDSDHDDALDSLLSALLSKENKGQLTHLDLSDNTILPPTIWKHFVHQTHIQELYLHNVEMDDWSFIEFGKSVQCHEHLHKLSIHLTEPLGPLGTTAANRFLENCLQLKSLTWGNNVGDNNNNNTGQSVSLPLLGLKKLAQAMSQDNADNSRDAQSLSFVHLQGCAKWSVEELGDWGLCAALKNLPQLTHLTLKRFNFTPAVVTNIVAALNHAQPPLTVLDLSENLLSCQSAQVLTGLGGNTNSSFSNDMSLRLIKSLKVVNLQDNQIDLNGATLLFRAFSTKFSHSGGFNLDLDNNNFNYQQLCMLLASESNDKGAVTAPVPRQYSEQSLLEQEHSFYMESNSVADRELDRVRAYIEKQNNSYSHEVTVLRNEINRLCEERDTLMRAFTIFGANEQINDFTRMQDRLVALEKIVLGGGGGSSGNISNINNNGKHLPAVNELSTDIKFQDSGPTYTGYNSSTSNNNSSNLQSDPSIRLSALYNEKDASDIANKVREAQNYSQTKNINSLSSESSEFLAQSSRLFMRPQPSKSGETFAQVDDYDGSNSNTSGDFLHNNSETYHNFEKSGYTFADTNAFNQSGLTFALDSNTNNITSNINRNTNDSGNNSTNITTGKLHQHSNNNNNNTRNIADRTANFRRSSAISTMSAITMESAASGRLVEGRRGENEDDENSSIESELDEQHHHHHRNLSTKKFALEKEHGESEENIPDFKDFAPTLPLHRNWSIPETQKPFSASMSHPDDPNDKHAKDIFDNSNNTNSDGGVSKAMNDEAQLDASFTRTLPSRSKPVQVLQNVTEHSKE